MSKRQLIDAIRQLNATAGEAFLGQFSEQDLSEYLDRLRGAQARDVRIYSSHKCRDSHVAS